MTDVVSDKIETSTPTEEAVERHLLPHKWSLWATCNARNTNSKRPPQRVSAPLYDFDSIEEFWAIYNSILKPNDMPKERCNVMIMRRTDDDRRINPEWEDEANVKGGEFVLEMHRGKEGDKQWEVTLLAMLGGSLPHSDDITGVWLIIRPKGDNQISLWNGTCADKNHVQELGDAWQKLLADYSIKPASCRYISHGENLRAAKTKGAKAVPMITWND